jgi:hypothetical protein
MFTINNFESMKHGLRISFYAVITVILIYLTMRIIGLAIFVSIAEETIKFLKDVKI